MPRRPREEDEDALLEAEMDDYKEYVPLKHRRIDKVKKATSIRKQLTTEQLAKKELEDEEKRLIAEAHREGPKSNRDLRGEAHQMRQEELAKPRDIIAEKLLEEQEIMDAMRAAKALKTAEELAFGVDYSESMPTEWRPPKWLRDRPESVNKAQRDQYMIELEGEGCPPMCARFEDMKLAPCIVDMLKSKGITKPTPIQMQGIPVLLSGRDMIGVAFTGSGKTLAFGIPAIMAAFDQEKKMPFVRGEGPYSVIMNPSRELARQTHDVLQEWAQCIEKGTGTKLCIALCMGQVDMNQYTRGHAGIHVMVATAGKLMGGLKTKRFTFELCRYFCLDEADRMIDLDQEEDIRTIFSYFKGQRQTVLFSATMPAKIRDFAKSALINHIAVTIGRSGAANLDVIQEVEYVKQEAKVMYLLECLQKTPPPVLVFSAKKGDVDDMYEYLLLKGVEAVAIHGGKDQDERDLAINSFKAGRKDVLVATDVASKGLDFAHIQHVINYDMPEELEDYIHRIGRTGRAGKTGIATTFINKMVGKTVLLDLKHLLIEAKQRVPPFLSAFTSEEEAYLDIGGIKGCRYCGGPGHRITDCPKLQGQQDKATQQVGRTDFTREGGGEY